MYLSKHIANGIDHDLQKGLVPNNKVIPKLYLSFVRNFGFVVMIVSITLTCVQLTQRASEQ